jgi:hypothetical protein
MASPVARSKYSCSPQDCRDLEQTHYRPTAARDIALGALCGPSEIEWLRRMAGRKKPRPRFHVDFWLSGFVVPIPEELIVTVSSGRDRPARRGSRSFS